MLYFSNILCEGEKWTMYLRIICHKNWKTLFTEEKFLLTFLSRSTIFTKFSAQHLLSIFFKKHFFLNHFGCMTIHPKFNWTYKTSRNVVQMTNIFAVYNFNDIFLSFFINNEHKVNLNTNKERKKNFTTSE